MGRLTNESLAAAGNKVGTGASNALRCSSSAPLELWGMVQIRPENAEAHVIVQTALPDAQAEDDWHDYYPAGANPDSVDAGKTVAAGRRAAVSFPVIPGVWYRAALVGDPGANLDLHVDLVIP